MAQETQDSDEQLLDNWFDGDAKAFEVFFLRHSKRVIGFCMKKGFSAEDAEDIAQRAFLKLSSRIHQYEKGRPALPWVFSIVANELKDYAKLRNRHGSKIENFAREYDAHHHETEDDGESSKLVGVAEKVLSPKSFEVVRLRIIEDKSFGEVAAETGKNEAASRRSFSRAIEKLRNWFKGKNGGEHE